MRIIDQVANILKVSHKARNDDRELFIIYMQKYGMNLSNDQLARFRAMPSLESIRRRRQILQERGLYPADEAVNERRYRDYQAIKGGDIQAEADSVVPLPGPVLVSDEIMNIINTEVYPT